MTTRYLVVDGLNPLCRYVGVVAACQTLHAAEKQRVQWDREIGWTKSPANIVATTGDAKLGDWVTVDGMVTRLLTPEEELSLWPPAGTREFCEKRTALRKEVQRIKRSHKRMLKQAAVIEGMLKGNTR